MVKIDSRAEPVREQTGQDIRSGAGAACLTARGNMDFPLQTVASGIQAGIAPVQFMDSIRAGNRQLGNRTFLHWVESLHAVPREKDTYRVVAQGVQGPDCLPAHTVPLQFGPKKHRRKKQPVTEDIAKSAARPQAQVTEAIVVAPAKTELSMREKELFKCCIQGNAARLKRLIRQVHVDFNVASPEGTLLCFAVYNGHTDVVRLLLSAPGINVHLATANGFTPLYLAIQQNHDEIVRLLLAQHGINVNLGELSGVTPLHLAASCGYEEFVRLLLANPGINVNPRKPNGATPLFIAAQNNRPGIVDLLLKHGADTNLGLLEDGSVPLMIATRRNNIEVVRLLLQQPDILVDRVTTMGVTALCIASGWGHDEIASLLLGKGADPDVLTNVGTGPLHTACIYRHPTTLSILLDAGADTQQKVSVAGREFTVYEIARLMGHQKLISLLEEHQLHNPAPAARLETLSLEDELPWSTPPATPPPEWSTPPSTPPPGWPSLPTVMPVPSPSADVAEIRPGEATSITSGTPDSPIAGATRPADTAQATIAAEAPKPDVPASQPAQAETQSTLAASKRALINEVLKKLDNETLEPVEGIRLMVDVNAAANIDMLCVMYNRLAGMERQRARARRHISVRHEMPAAGSQSVLPHTLSPGYALGKRQNLDADAAEGEIRQHLPPACHRFVNQAVNDMEFGRGKPTSGYPGLLHASAGVPGVGSCSVFYYADAARNLIRIVGIGHHLDAETYRLDYATGELRGCHTLRLS